MKIDLNSSLMTELDKLIALNSVIIDAGKRNMTAEKGLFQFDLFFIPLLNKALNLNVGYVNLVQNGNFITAGALVRIQLDNLLRLFAPSIIDINPDEFASQILGGKKLNSFKDRLGKHLKDFYLAEQLSKNTGYEWVLKVYEEGHQYVHYTTHSLYAGSSLNDEKREITFTIGPHDQFVPLKEKLTATFWMRVITEAILDFASIWINHKNGNDLN
jgi:hypothetical protein